MSSRSPELTVSCQLGRSLGVVRAPAASLHLRVQQGAATVFQGQTPRRAHTGGWLALC